MLDIKRSVAATIMATIGWVLLALATPTQAESTNARPCDDGSGQLGHWQPGFEERLVGVCGLENTINTFTYDGSANYQGELQFTVRSCFPGWQGEEICQHAVPYSVTISSDTPQSGDSFYLCRNPGCSEAQSFGIELDYTSGAPPLLTPPNIEVPQSPIVSQLFPGGANGLQMPASLTVRVVRTPNSVQNDTYAGDFLLTIRQCSSARPIGGGSVCNGQYQYTDLINLPFRIELLPNAQIRISGLQDMPLSMNPGTGAAGSQTFCVESSGGALFRMTADSANGSGQFLLQGVDQLQYSAEVEHLPSGSSEDLSEGQVSTSTWSGHSGTQCQGLAQENMQITISVDQEELDEAQSTSYSDTLTLTVELE